MAHRPNVFQILTGIVVAIIIALVVGVAGWGAAVIADLQDQGAARQSEVDSLVDAVDEANQRLESAGEAPVSLPDSAAAQGERGAAGRDGEPGRDGKDGTDGEDGEDGTDGRDGAPGEPGRQGQSVRGDPGERGEPGRAPTPEEVAAAVAAFCGQATVPCRGATGDTGQTGAAGTPGANGRGVVSLECQADGSWLVTYTDQTTSTTPGPCRVTLIPTPEVAP